ncbi:hypothetical protein JHK85_042913 [Glycine max]|nr:hypothetical protein JHK85_042913 [Glycine max]
MESSEDPIIQVKDEQLMVSPLSGENPVHRTAYFIKPCVEDSATLPHSMFSSGRTATVNSDHAKLLEVRYKGWHYPSAEWNTWVQQMQHKYECVWMKAGIDQAIKASTFQIRRNDELIIELAQRWCSKTNTFVFPWGEATITLEDMKVCWGYSVMGAPISSPLVSGEEREIEQKLIGVFRMFFKSKARRADHTPWMKHFMSNESRVEHEAFLSLWLSRFVFPDSSFNPLSFPSFSNYSTMESSEDPIIQVKDEQLMVSPLSGENPVHRTAYFIKPCVEDSATLPHSMFSSGRTATVNSDHAKLLEVRYKGWHYPSAEWNTWVQQMQHKYECVWMKAGIDQAIKASTFQIRRNDELIIELAPRGVF